MWFRYMSSLRTLATYIYRIGLDSEKFLGAERAPRGARSAYSGSLFRFWTAQILKKKKRRDREFQFRPFNRLLDDSNKLLGHYVDTTT